MATKTATQDDWIGTREIMDAYGVSRNTAWRLMREPGAPVHVPLGKANMRARRGEFDQWLRARSDRIAAAAS